MAPSTSSYPTSRESSYKAEEAKRGEAQKRWERPSVNRTNLKINIKGKEIKEPTRPQANLKLVVDKHQRSKNDPTPDFESLLADNVPENNAATERHTSTLIENFDQSEFIRNVIIQSKKLGGNRFGSPGQANPESAIPHHRSKRIDDKWFIKDMKKHGILKAFNDINKFTEFFQNSPSANQEMPSAASIVQKHSSSGNLEYDYHSSSMQNIADAAQDKNTKSTYILEEMENEEKTTKTLKSFKFIFPFQRRARSHSPPKNSVITNKIIETMNNNSPDGVLGQGQPQKQGEQVSKQKNKAVVANPNFLIGSYHLLNKREKLQAYIDEGGNREIYGDEDHILQGKEVEEWLMGSGLSIPDATTGCTDNSELNKQFSSNLSGLLNTLKLRQIEKEVENPTQKHMDDWGEFEEWMFDSLNMEKENRAKDANEADHDDEQIPDESSLDGNCFGNMPVFPSSNKRSPYIHKDQIIEEEDELESEFIDPTEQFGFKNLSSYMSQMDRWIEEGKTFK